MRLLCQIASGEGSFINADSSCVISALQRQDIKKQKGWGMREDIDTSAKVMMVLLTVTGPRHVSLMQPNLFGRD